MILQYTFEKDLRNGKDKVIEVEVLAHVNSATEIDDLSYEDFKILLYLNRNFVADLSPILGKMGVLAQIIDGIDWMEIYKENLNL